MLIGLVPSPHRFAMAAEQSFHSAFIGCRPSCRPHVPLRHGGNNSWHHLVVA